jgi:small subunit ribosomal protein S8
MVSDPVSDFIIRLKNASDVQKSTVSVSQSKLIENIAHALKKAGYIASVNQNKGEYTLNVGIAYVGAQPRINGVERISRSSRRIYLKSADIRVFRSGFGNTFLSTPKGIVSDMEAKKLKVGGEVLFRIW